MDSVKKLISLGIDILIFIGSFAMAAVLMAKLVACIEKYFQMII